MDRQKVPALALMLLTVAGLCGCGPRKATTVDPLPDPIFRDTPGPLEYQSRRSTGPDPISISLSHRTSSRSQAANGPWTVANLSDRWKYIIIHHSATQAGGAKRFDEYHRRPKYLGGAGWEELGYHFVIGNGMDTADGQIEVGSRWYKQKHGAHTRVPGDETNEYNEHGIGICLVGNFNYGQPDPVQMAALLRLTKGLLAYTNLPPSAVHYHRDYKGTDCPGKYFPYEAFQEALQR